MILQKWETPWKVPLLAKRAKFLEYSTPLLPTLRIPIEKQRLKNYESYAEPEIWVRSLSQEDPLEKGMATHSSIFA